MARVGKAYRYYHHMNFVSEGTIPEIAKETGVPRNRLYNMPVKDGHINPNNYNRIKDYLVFVRQDFKEYALYSGDDILSLGTLDEIASAMRIEKDTVKWYGTPAGKSRGKRTLIKLDDEEEVE